METWQIILLLVLAIFMLLTLVAVLAGVLYRSYAKKCTSQARLDGKTVLITGATAGIGKEAAIILAGRGCRLIIASLYEREGKDAADEIISKTGNTNVVVRVVDVADLDSVRRFAAKINAEEQALHVLVNNASIAIETKRTSPQGFELVLATNHYGCFLLTNLLMNKLKSSAPSRIVTAASVLHLFGRIDLNDLNFDTRPFRPSKAYNQSKLCNVLFTKELARRLEGTGVTANCQHPGLVFTSIHTNDNGYCASKIKPVIVKIVGRTPVQGAQTTVHLCLSEEVEGVSGKYYDNCREGAVSFQARDMELARKLWDVSGRDVKLTPEEAKASIILNKKTV